MTETEEKDFFETLTDLTREYLGKCHVLEIAKQRAKDYKENPLQITPPSAFMYTDQVNDYIKRLAEHTAKLEGFDAHIAEIKKERDSLYATIKDMIPLRNQWFLVSWDNIYYVVGKRLDDWGGSHAVVEFKHIDNPDQIPDPPKDISHRD